MASGGIIRAKAALRGPKELSSLPSVLRPLEGAETPGRSPWAVSSLSDVPEWLPQGMEQTSFLVPRLPERQSLGRGWVDGRWSRARTGKMPTGRESRGEK